MAAEKVTFPLPEELVRRLEKGFSRYRPAKSRVTG